MSAMKYVWVNHSLHLVFCLSRCNLQWNGYDTCLECAGLKGFLICSRTVLYRPLRKTSYVPCCSKAGLEVQLRGL